MSTITEIETRNRHPVDELADIRARIRELQEREAELRQIIIDDPEQRDGEEFKADIAERSTERADMKALKREFGLNALRPYMKTTKATLVNIYNKSMGRPLSPFAKRRRREAVKDRPAVGPAEPAT